MKRKVLAAACVLAAVSAAPATAQRRQAITSAYTNLDLDRCRVIREVTEGASVEWRCPGYGGVPLWVAIGDERFDIDAPRDNGAWESTPMFNDLGDRVEWRLRGGRPFAIIYRLRLFGENPRPRSVLAVETVGQGRRGGCLIAWVDGATEEANVAAREQADRYAGSFRCGRDEARVVGRSPNDLD